MKQATETMVPIGWEVSKDQDTINVQPGASVSIRSGVNVKNCYIHGGTCTIRACANVGNCIVNRGELIINTGGEIGSLLVKEGAKLNIHSGVKIKNYRSTGAILLSMYPKSSLKS